MPRRLFATILILGLVLPDGLWAQGQIREAAQANPPAVAKAAPPPAAPAAQQVVTPQTTRPQANAARRRSYEREVHGRRHSRISKKEWVLLGALAGSSMGIGALAGGAHGLAIGAIVGGWSAFAAHHLWKHLH
jgi:hypothetical protein